MPVQIYDGNRYDTTNRESCSYLQVNSCGINRYPGNDAVTVRERGRVDYHILYIAEGWGEVAYLGAEEELKKGGFVLYPPHVLQRYRLFENSRTIWLHFNGYYVKEILDDAHLSCGIHRIGYSAAIEEMFVRLISEHNRRQPVSAEKGMLLSSLYYLGKLACGANDTENRIQDCISMLVSGFDTPLRIDALAAYCGLSRSRFLDVFRRAAGMPPHQYLQQLRLNSCKSMLISTSLSVADIARLSGYDDPLYFSRIFKRRVGLSPTAFRKKYGARE